MNSNFFLFFIQYSFRYPLFGLSEQKLTLSNPGLPQRWRGTEDAVVAEFLAPTSIAVDTFFHHPLILRLSSTCQGRASGTFGVSALQLSKFFDKEEKLVNVCYQ